MAQLAFQGVKKMYAGGVSAVQDFTMEIADGEFVILVGPSGCGKSTLLRMIAGLEDITEGEIRIGGKPVNHMEPKDRNIAMVFQDYALYPHMTVYQNMAFSLRMRKIPKADVRRRVEEIARQLELTELLARKPRALSGGQRQRVALGRAMVREPAVFLLDEPLSNLDAKLRTTMRAEITKLHHRLQGTFVYVTHDQTEAMTMGDRIVVMRDGVVQQADTPKNLYENPCNLFVACFIGSPQMNIAKAVWKDSGKSLLFAGKTIPLMQGQGGISSWIHQDMPVLMGIRPEHITLCEARQPGAIAARVELNELLGAESYLHLDVAEHKMVARVAPCEIQPGEQVYLSLSMDKLCMFDADTEQRVY